MGFAPGCGRSRDSLIYYSKVYKKQACNLDCTLHMLVSCWGSILAIQTDASFSGTRLQCKYVKDIFKSSGFDSCAVDVSAICVPLRCCVICRFFAHCLYLLVFGAPLWQPDAPNDFSGNTHKLLTFFPPSLSGLCQRDRHILCRVILRCWIVDSLHAWNVPNCPQFP